MSASCCSSWEVELVVSVSAVKDSKEGCTRRLFRPRRAVIVLPELEDDMLSSGRNDTRCGPAAIERRDVFFSEPPGGTEARLRLLAPGHQVSRRFERTLRPAGVEGAS